MSVPPRLEPNPFAYQSFTEYEAKLVDDHPLTQLEIVKKMYTSLFRVS